MRSFSGAPCRLFGLHNRHPARVLFGPLRLWFMPLPPLAADILDFKTDAIDPKDPNALKTKVNHYRPQIEAYRNAVVQMAGLPKSHVGARLLFVGSGDSEAIQ